MNPHGHRLFYVAMLAKGALTRQQRPVLWLPKGCVDSGAYSTHIGPLVNSVDIQFYSWGGNRSGVQEVRARLRLLRTVGRTLGASGHLILPDGDQWLPTLVFAGSAITQPKVHALLLRTHARSKRQFLNRLAKYTLCLLSKRRTHLLRLVPPFQSGKSPWWDPFSSLDTVSDPLPTVERTDQGTARSRLALPADRFIALVAGFIDTRKSTGHLFRWLEQSSLRPRPLLLLAGEMSQGVASELEQFADRSNGFLERLVIDNRHLPNEQLDLYYSAADAVLILHENEGPSGALAYAVAHSRPVVAWGSRSVVQTVVRASLGSAISDREPQSLDEGIQRALEGKHLLGIDVPTTSPGAKFLGAFLEGKGCWEMEAGRS